VTVATIDPNPPYDPKLTEAALRMARRPSRDNAESRQP